MVMTLTALILTGCVAANYGHGVPVVSQCSETVTVVFHDSDPDPGGPFIVDVSPEGTSLGMPLDVDRVWFENADGDVLNEVTLTADQVTDPDADFEDLVIEASHCDQLEPAPTDE
jgi:hypothetical protein